MAGTGHRPPAPDDALLRVEDLVVEFPGRRRRRSTPSRASASTCWRARPSVWSASPGCGKSTTGRAIMQLPPPTSGACLFEGTTSPLSSKSSARLRRRMQMIFQDPISSLNPRRKVVDIVAEPLAIWGAADEPSGRPRSTEVLEAVGLDPEVAGRSGPHQFSGGQCQRISIARALVLDPKLIICDEPVSALDVSVQAQILNLLEDMKARYGLTLIFIAHDLAVVKNVSDRVAVMYLGKLCEVAARRALREPGPPLHRSPARRHPGARPEREPATARSLAAILPSPIDPPSGCRFRTRCPRPTSSARTRSR